jgi:Flp pilus assembly pilin Flp
VRGTGRRRFGFFTGKVSSRRGSALIGVLCDQGRRGTRMGMTIKRLWADERGLETVEWGVMAALIVGAVIAALTVLGSNVLAQFEILVTATE